jgi:hypothetical protein
MAMNKQRGMTFISLVLMIAGIVFVAVIGMKLYPAYAEYLTIKRAFSSLKRQMNDAEMTKSAIVVAFNKQREIDGFHSVLGKDLVIEQSTNGTVVSVEYSVVTPLVGNVSALMDFSLSTDETAKQAAE